jgi:hypothetical protein
MDYWGGGKGLQGGEWRVREHKREGGYVKAPDMHVWKNVTMKPINLYN